MGRFATWLGITAPVKLGRCAFCMRSASASALLFSSAAAIAYLAGFAAASAFLAVAAALLTLLWIAHLTARASRRTARIRAESGGTSRREFLPIFVRAFAAAAVATAFPPLILRAFADDDPVRQCSDTVLCLDQFNIFLCCPQSAPYMCDDDCTCRAKTDGCKSFTRCDDECGPR